MTDTGQVPGEGQPENTGGQPEQPGTPAAGAYAFQTPPPHGGHGVPERSPEATPEADEDDLLLPGAQGAWGDPTAAGTTSPTATPGTVPGTHETGGRDSGAFDNSAVRNTAPRSHRRATPEGTGRPAPARRPLHLGPPIPEQSGTVRSLADRGPAPAPANPGRPAAPAQDGAPATPQAHRPRAARHAAPQAPVQDVPAARQPGDAQPQAGHGPQAAPQQPTADGPAEEASPQRSAPAAGTAPDVGPAEDPALSGPQLAKLPGPDLAALPDPPAPPEPVPGQRQAGPVEADVSHPAPDPTAQSAVPAGTDPVVPAAPSGAEAAAAPTTEEAVTASAEQHLPPVGAPDRGEPSAGGDTPVGPVPQHPEASAGAAASPAPPTPDGEQPAAAPGAPATAEVGEETGGAGPPAEPAGAPQQPGPPAPPGDGQAASHAAAFAPDAGAPAAGSPVTEATGEAAARAAAQPAQSVPAEEGEGAPVAAATPPAEPTTDAPAAQTSPAPHPPVPEPTAGAPAPEPHPVSTAPSPADGGQPPQDRAEAGEAGPVGAEDAPAPTAAQVPPAAEPVAEAVAATPEPEEAGVEPDQGADDTASGSAAVTGTVPSPRTEEAVPGPAATESEVAEENTAGDGGAEATGAETPEAAVAAAHEDAAVARPEGAETAGRPAAAEPSPSPATSQDGQRPDESAAGHGESEREALHRVMRQWRDVREGFRPDPVPDDVLLRVLEAAHTAPSVGHSQPWDFVVIRSAETRRAVQRLLERQREEYARSLPKGRAKQFKQLTDRAVLDAPVNIVVTADPTRGGRHALGRHAEPRTAPYSTVLAVENLLLAAQAEGLGVGWADLVDERELVRELGLPDHLEIVAYLCVGYVDPVPEKADPDRTGGAAGRPLSWVVHEEEYGRRVLPGAEPHDLLAETLAGIRPLDAKALGEAWERQKRMTKPSGSLGMLEIISAQLSGLSRKCPPPVPEPAALAVFAADHGVHDQGVTAWPQEVTTQMVANIARGGAVCNAFAAQVGAEVCVVDVGLVNDPEPAPGLLPRKVRPGTADFTSGPALTREEAQRAVEVGIETARDLVAAGNRALLTGEMGVANTTAAAALVAVFTETDPAEVTGRGTGISDEMHARKIEVVRRGLELHSPDATDPIGVLAALGGLEHAALVGLILGGASLRTPVVLDGVSAGAAALAARALAPEALAACIAGHRSAEPGHVAALTKLGLRPLVDLDLRLGEGTGALLALPVVQSAARAMHEVATFDAAGVTGKS